MSQFAHGIRSLDIQNSDPQIVFLLGTKYDRLSEKQTSYLSHFESILWMTYRKDFAAMVPYDYTSDAGWGCMLRSAQMILCQSLQRHLLGPKWRIANVTQGFVNNDTANSNFQKLLTWFVDTPQEEAIYSIHNMVKIGMQYDKLPGEWYGPTTAAQVIRDLVNLQRQQFGGFLSMYVPQEGVVYTDEVMQLCTEQPIGGGSEISGEAATRSDYSADGVLYDPLLNPPESNIDPSREWQTALLILIPLRLGLDRLNETYIPALQKIFELKQCVGIIGGKRAHSVYFVGVQGSSMHILDPHTVHSTAEINSSFPSAAHVRTMHSSTPLVMEMGNIDPSLALGFYCRDIQDYNLFCTEISRIEKECTFPFTISATRPDYDFSGGGMDDLMSDSGNSQASDSDSEFVMI